MRGGTWGVCVRADFPATPASLQSKKWASLYVVNALFRLYFKLNQLRQCRFFINAVEVRGSRAGVPPCGARAMRHMPSSVTLTCSPLSHFPCRARDSHPCRSSRGLSRWLVCVSRALPFLLAPLPASPLCPRPSAAPR